MSSRLLSLLHLLWHNLGLAGLHLHENNYTAQTKCNNNKQLLVDVSETQTFKYSLSFVIAVVIVVVVDGMEIGLQCV
jgi:hypothetical protein